MCIGEFRFLYCKHQGLLVCASCWRFTVCWMGVCLAVRCLGLVTGLGVCAWLGVYTCYSLACIHLGMYGWLGSACLAECVHMVSCV